MVPRWKDWAIVNIQVDQLARDLRLPYSCILICFIYALSELVISWSGTPSTSRKSLEKACEMEWAKFEWSLPYQLDERERLVVIQVENWKTNSSPVSATILG